MLIIFSFVSLSKNWFTTENDYEENVNTTERYRPKPIDDLVKETRFNKKEIQLLYRGFKQVKINTQLIFIIFEAIIFICLTHS
jgi:hypothetical protein